MSKIMASKALSIEIALGTPSGAVKRAKFVGYAYIDSGFLAGRIVEHNGLTRNELVLLTAFTLTGCPVAARTQRPDLNPWLKTEGAYIGERQLKSTTFSATSRLSANASGNAVQMTLSVNYGGNLPKLKGVAAPFQEFIEEETIGRLRGRFELPFVDSSNHIHVARADTTYNLPIREHTERVWRNITILDVFSSDSFNQIEQIDMFESEASARIDIESKTQVGATCEL